MTWDENRVLNIKSKYNVYNEEFNVPNFSPE